jgi:hypothetical protein
MKYEAAMDDHPLWHQSMRWTHLLRQRSDALGSTARTYVTARALSDMCRPVHYLLKEN